MTDKRTVLLAALEESNEQPGNDESSESQSQSIETSRSSLNEQQPDTNSPSSDGEQEASQTTPDVTEENETSGKLQAAQDEIKALKAELQQVYRCLYFITQRGNKIVGQRRKRKVAQSNFLS